MKTKHDDRLKEIEAEKLEHIKDLKKLECFEEDMHYHIQNTNQTLLQLSEGFQGDEAKKMAQRKEESMQVMYTETLQHVNEKRDDYQKEIRLLNRTEEDIIEQKRKGEDTYDI